MEFIDEKILDYAQNHSDPENELLAKINRETNAEVLMPRMLSGHMQGRTLSMFSKMKSPKTILEIGTYTGYSALCLAEGVQKGGKLITLDINEELENRVRGYFLESAYAEIIDYRIGNALELIPQINEKLDLVFIDADKENYSKYFDLVLPKMNQGGIILVDNVLWSGKVLSEKKDSETEAINNFNQKLRNFDAVDKVLMPIRDGITIIYVK